jgi:signal transduction histidine kinase
MDDAFEMIGTSEFEFCHSKADGIEFYKAQIQEVVGKTEMRNRIISHKPLGDMFLVNEACDVYILGTPEWTFYSKLRLSTILHETKSGWKIIQQHGSLPDMRVEKGETMAFEKITKENLELRDAVKRRTAELESKSRELAIEAALEKVRAVAMGMKKPKDMLEVCEAISDRLKDLGVSQIRNIQTAIIDEEKGIYLCYQYFTQYGSVAIERTEYFKSPVEEDMVRQMLASKDGHFTGMLTGEKLVEFREHRKAENHFPDPLLDESEEISHCFLSIGRGGLGLTLYQAMDDSTLDLFKRFHQVFSLAYQRFHDIQKAEARAREVEIDLALERVRAQTMAMHSSEDVGNCILKMFAELTALGVDEGTRFGIGILNYENENNELWTARMEGKEVKMHIGNIDMKAHPLLKSARKAWLEKVIFHKYILEGKDLLDYYQMLNKAPDYKIQIPLEKLPQREVQHCFIFEHGFFYAFSPQEFQPELIQTIQRFSTQFAQTYRRYLDLVMAEAQAREARIEAALEKVRSRSLAMHRSDELKGVIQEVYDQLLQLKIHVDHAGFIIDYKEREDMHIWLADHQQGVPTEITIPYFDTPHWNSYREAKARQESFFANLLPFEVKNKFYQDLFKWIPDLTGEAQQAIFTKPALAISTVLLDNVGLYIEHYSETPYTAEENKILMRIGKVFQQTYTRFLDLQKAEAQAREARIEAALERVRARSMAMQKTEDLREVVKVLFEQMQRLSVDMGFASVSIFIFEDGSRNIRQWLPLPDGVSSLSVPYFDHPISSDLFDAKESGVDFFKKIYTLEEKNTWLEYGFEHTDYKDLPVAFKSSLLQAPGYAIAITLAKYSGICIPSFEGKLPSPEDIQIMKRVGKVFEQAYIRFLDLQKAEAQVREAQIQLALERIRARTMAMQKSEELAEVSFLLNKQVVDLGIPTRGCAFNIYNEHDSTEWFSNLEGTLPAYKTPRENIFLKYYEAGHRGETLLIEEFGKERIKQHYAYLHSLHLLGDDEEVVEKIRNAMPEFQIDHVAFFKYGYLLFITLVPAPEAHDIFKRFAKEFEQTYTRFLDLQKVEAQAREARIEAALERVRSRTMGMQKAEELGEVATILFAEMNTLVENLWTCGFVLCEKNRKEDEWWLSLTNGLIEPFSLPNIGDYAHEMLYKGWEKGKAYRKVTLENKLLQEHYNWLMRIPIARKIFEDMEGSGIPRPNWQCLHAAYFKTGYLVIITEVPCEEEEVFKRFAQVFDLTYTRFLDLQKAEKQARESQIQAALEKVRSRSLAMQSPAELIEVAQLLREEMGALDVEDLETSSIYIQDESSGLTECWFTIKNTKDPGKAVADQMTIKLEETWVGRQMRDFFQSSAEKTSILMQGKNRIEWIRYCEGKSKLFGTSNFYGETIPERTYHLYKFSNGYIGAAAPGEISSESWDLLKRATAVFSFAFTRFQDLQRAEASARASMRQASLDRLRADISSMRSASDLDRITPLIFKELTVLGVPFIRCGVFIIQEKQKIVEAYLSSPEGNSLGVLRLPYQASELTYQTVEAWRKGVVYHQHWNKEDFIRWINQLMEQDQIQDSSTYQGAAAPPESLDLHFVPFKQGMLYVGNVSPLGEDEIELVQSLAKAFSIAYARFEDFVKLEQAKVEVESAMSELKATQSQLVQQEKLASLGQLTAGIAHEIKNPLNFVNNFSEVSIELVDEAIEERAKSQEARDETLVDEILEDIKSNLKKVHEHGSRANGIVTSMLQHSRGGSGKKEPTDLNALTKEYVNLSFHGMRAGKNPINVDIILNLDPEIKEVSLIKEDFTRVIINLCNNAFDAMRGKKYEDGEPLGGSYSPKLRASTILKNGQIKISFEDNGPGIPDEIKDKILQPFFTTKKGTEGTGLGLSITHDIVKAHGGELRVESEIGKGTTFTVILNHHPSPINI